MRNNFNGEPKLSQREKDLQEYDMKIIKAISLTIMLTVWINAYKNHWENNPDNSSQKNNSDLIREKVKYTLPE